MKKITVELTENQVKIIASALFFDDEDYELAKRFEKLSQEMSEGEGDEHKN